MATRAPRPLRPQFDSLDRRDTPTTLGVVGSGVMNFFRALPLSGGGAQVTYALTGNTNVFGAFSGGFTETFTPGSTHVTATAAFRASNGSVLVAKLDGHILGIFHVNNTSFLVSSFSATVAAGTGTFANVHGSGSFIDAFPVLPSGQPANTGFFSFNATVMF